MRAVFAFLLLVSAVSTAPAQSGDWRPGFGAPGVDGDVEAMLVYDDGSGPALYVGGAFDDAGGLAATGIARWDGAMWTGVGPGLAHFNVARVKAMALYDDGGGTDLYVGGNFTQAGNIFASRIARWNGVAWTGLQSGVFGTNQAVVNALVVHDDGSGPALYAAGDFTAAGPVGVANVARWDGASWSPVGTGLGGDEVNTLEVHQGQLYAGGDFTVNSGGVNLAVWDGTNWTGLGNVTNNLKEVYDLEVYDHGTGPQLYVGLDRVKIGGTTVRGIARWNGTDFKMLGGAWVSGDVHALEVFDPGSGPELFMTGNFWYARYSGSLAGALLANGLTSWNGSNWSKFSTGLEDEGDPGVGLALAEFDDGFGPTFFVGGQFDLAGSTNAHNISRRATSQGFTPVGGGHGMSGNVRAYAVFDDGTGPALYAGGTFEGKGPLYGPTTAKIKRLAKWVGNGWDDVGGGISAGEVNDLVVYDDGTGPALYVGGNFQVGVQGGIAVRDIARWDGTQWDDVDTGIPAGFVRAMKVFDGGAGPELYVAGQFKAAGSNSKPTENIARWNGTKWRTTSKTTNAQEGLFNGEVWALEVWDDGNGTDLYACGEFTAATSSAGGSQPFITTKGIAGFDGIDWFAFGALGDSRALRAYDDGSGSTLYADNYGSVRWDGTKWVLVGGALNGMVNDYVAYDDGNGMQLYATGAFLDAGLWFNPTTLGLDHMARWDGTEWWPVAAPWKGLDRTGATLFVHPVVDGEWPSLWVGGRFDEAGDHPASGLAVWSNACACEGSAYCTAGTSASGCVAQISSTGQARRSSASGFTVTVTSAEGAKDGLFYFSTLGQQAWPWGQSSSFQCVTLPVQRTGLLTGTGTAGACDGTLQLDFNGWMTAHPGKAPAAGASAYLQCWVRDPLSTSNRFSALSDALRFGVCP
jgi:hypothetical protein